MKVSWTGKLRKKEMPHRHSETDHVLETILKPYFKTASFNCHGINEPFAFNAHCDNHHQPCLYGRTVEIPTGPMNRECTFWVCNGDYPEFMEDSPNIQLTATGRYAGLLCPETQTLWATGWTHLEEYRYMTQHIINFLAEQGLLRPLPPIPLPSVPKKKRVKKEKQVFTITIGGDPEFELIDNDGMVVNANNSEGFGIKNEFGNVGVDGSGYQIELRPSPGSPEAVVDNTRKLLEEFNTNYGEDFRLAASSSRYPCGGHIHIGIEPLPDTIYYRRLSGILDEFIGKNTIKLNGPARGGGNEYNYGRIGDFRQQPYGMEYRTPPSAVWKNPKLTEIVLKLTYNLAINLANNLSLEFPTPVEKEALVTVGGLCDEEATIYLQECTKPAPKNTECLLAAWEIERKVPKPKIKVTYRDSWYSGVQRTINSELAKIEVSNSINLTFYGLIEGRRDVYTFDVPGKVKIPHPQKDSGPTSFGFSAFFRGGGPTTTRIIEIAQIIGKMVMGLQKSKIEIGESSFVEELIDSHGPRILEEVPSSFEVYGLESHYPEINRVCPTTRFVALRNHFERYLTSDSQDNADENVDVS